MYSTEDDEPVIDTEVILEDDFHGAHDDVERQKEPTVQTKPPLRQSGRIRNQQENGTRVTPY